MVKQTVGIRAQGEVQIFHIEGEYDFDELRTIVKDEIPDANPILIGVRNFKKPLETK